MLCPCGDEQHNMQSRCQCYLWVQGQVSNEVTCGLMLCYSRNVRPTWVRFFCNETGEVLSLSSVCKY
jgi:hypothetical protein